MNTIHTVLVSVALATILPAQTQLLRGKVEDVRNTQNQFYLDGTAIPLVSGSLNLNQFVGFQTVMQVVDIGTAGNTVLDVRSAAVAPKIFDMGNLRFGRAERWQVSGLPGSQTAVFAVPLSATSYAPLGAFGTWLLGPSPAYLASGAITVQGQFEFRLTMPNIPSLIGASFTAQAAVQEPSGRFFLTNADSKEVRSN